MMTQDEGESVQFAECFCFLLHILPAGGGGGDELKGQERHGGEFVQMWSSEMHDAVRTCSRSPVPDVCPPPGSAVVCDAQHMFPAYTHSYASCVEASFYFAVRDCLLRQTPVSTRQGTAF